MGQPATAGKHFGRYLGVLLKTHDLSAVQLAEAAQLEPEFIVRLLTGEHILTGDVALSLADALGLSPVKLLEAQRTALLDSRELRVLKRLAA